MAKMKAKRQLSRKPSQRMQSDSKYGQSLAARANESKGARKAELNKLSRVDKQDFKMAPKAVQTRIVKDMRNKEARRVREQNSGEII